MKRIVVLGSTGSIGTQTLDVIKQNPTRLKVVALAAYSNAKLLAEQAQLFGVEDKNCILVSAIGKEHGAEAVAKLASLDNCDIVVNALVGAAGLQASYEAIKAGKVLALANKESLVVGGDLLMPLLRTSKATLLPVDSEHSAVFQCLLGEDRSEVKSIWLTASGGPFYGYSRTQLAEVTKEDTLKHPTWNMGPKITVDSATLMNKGLEVIEAHHLFSISYDDIKIVIHPQSCIHSMVAYADGSVKAHLGVTDMRIPIQYALSYPKRWDDATGRGQLDFTKLGSLNFSAPDADTFGCLRLACEAGRVGGTLPAVLNAANETAVAAFLNGSITFLAIEQTVAAAMEYYKAEKVVSIKQLASIDSDVRSFASAFFKAAT